jgi:hypothetical protein
MITSLLVWYLSGILAWLFIRATYGGEVYVGDIMGALVIGISGPIIPLTIGSWYLAVWLETTARVIIWKRK